MWDIVKNNISGQSTIEFAIVTAAILIIVIGLSLFWNLGDMGILVSHAVGSASHHLEDTMLGIVGDLFCV